MGQYDDIGPDELKEALRRFSSLVDKLDDDDALLDAVPRLMKLLGELRQMLFAWEIRGSKKLGPGEKADEEPSPEAGGGQGGADSLTRESLRVVKEAIEREKELLEELGRPHEPDQEEEEE